MRDECQRSASSLRRLESMPADRRHNGEPGPNVAVTVDDGVMGGRFLSMVSTGVSVISAEAELGALVRDMQSFRMHAGRGDVEDDHMAARAVHESSDLKRVEGGSRQFDANSLR